MEYIIRIKDLDIPFIIKNYKTAKSMKIYFKENSLTITKSPYISKKEVLEFIKNNEERVYKEYKRILYNKENIDKYSSGNYILYKGEKYKIIKEYFDKNTVKILIDENNRQFNIFVSDKITKQEEDYYIKDVLRKIFKNNTEVMLKDKISYWSKITNIKYNNVKVRDAKTKFGSCIPKTRDLHFTSRLIMLKEQAVDAVIVHELCHIIYPNHSKDFYTLVEKYIPDYKEINKYLKLNSKNIRNIII